MAARVNWELRSRVVEGESGLAGAVLVTDRQTPDGTVTAVDASAVDPELAEQLLRWGLDLSRAAGATAAQVWCRAGLGRHMSDLGLELVRTFLRMDRSLVEPLPAVRPVGGYEIVDGTSGRVSSQEWVSVHNRAFADHWRFSPRTESELGVGRFPELGLLALGEDGSPVSITLGQVNTYDEDPRPQPVGLVRSVGTVPAHRRKGLGRWLVAEVMQRLQRASVPHASLYVDGMNATRAFDLYRDLGFEVQFESEVWEATFP